MKIRSLNNWTLGVVFIALATLLACDPVEDKVEGDFSGQLTETEIENGIMTAEIMWKFGRVGEQKLSPDGKTILYTVTRYDYKINKSITDIFMLATAGGDPVKLSGSDGAYYNARWKGDGETIGYITSGQLWEMSPDGSGKIRVSDVGGGINGFEYSPNGSKILYLKEVKYKETPNEIHADLPLANVYMMEELMYRHWNHWEDDLRSHIFVGDLADGGLSNDVDIMEGEPYDAPLSAYFDQAEISWNADGTKIAYTCKKMHPTEYARSTDSDIYLYDLESKTTVNLTEGMDGYDKYPSFSPDGKKMAWQSMETPGYEADKDRLMVLDLVSGVQSYLTKEFDQDAENLVWSDDSKTIWFKSGIESTFQIYNIEVESKVITQVTEGIHDITSFEMAEGVISATKMSVRQATEIYTVDAGSGELTQVSFVNKNIYDNIEMGDVKRRWVETTDGKQMMVSVVYPPGFDETKEYPAIMFCTGGPQGALSQFFSYRWNFQMMAAGGYVVVIPNRRGVDTYGQEWVDQIGGDYGGQNMQDYLVAIDEVSKEPYIDEDRLGAVGASYGGYSVFYLAGIHEGRFKAFISHCGIYNTESMYAETEEVFFVHRDNGGAPWEDPKPVNYSYSPHLKVQNWDTPILIISGEYDLRIPYTQSMQAFNAAQLLGVPSKLLIFPEETHFVTKPQNAILWQREFRGWLDAYLK